MSQSKTDVIMEEVGDHVWLKALSDFGIEWMREHLVQDTDEEFEAQHVLCLTERTEGILNLMKEHGLAIVEGNARSNCAD